MNCPSFPGVCRKQGHCGLTPAILALLLFLLFCALPLKLHSQDSSTFDTEHPSWIVLEKGKRAFREGELGLALYFFRETLNKQDLTAEAHTWIGRIHEAEGEYQLAEDAYRRAIAEKQFFYVWEERYEPMRLLASVLAKSGDTEDALVAYQDLIDLAVQEESELFQPSFLLDQFLEKGYDTFFELYRPRSSQTILARAEKGALLRSLGREREALENYLMAIAIPSSMVIELLLQENPGYRFLTAPAGYRNTLGMLIQGERNPTTTAFLVNADFYQSMYAFSRLLRDMGHEKPAREGFLMLSNLQGDLRLRQLALESLAPEQ